MGPFSWKMPMKNLYDEVQDKLKKSNTFTQPDLQCLLCRESTKERLMPMQDKNTLILKIRKLNIKYDPIPMVVEFICVRCICKVNVVLEFRHKMERNIMYNRSKYCFLNNTHLVHNSTSKAVEPLQLGANDESIVDETPNTENYILISNADTQESDINLEFDFNYLREPMGSEKNINIPDTSADSPSKLLEPMYETSESVLATESGGTITLTNEINTAYSSRMKNSNLQLKCQFCPKTYKRLAFLKKHERKHSNQAKRKTGGKAAVRSTVGYSCDRCGNMFETKAQLKNHEKSHRNRYKCPYCLAEFVIAADLEWHKAICYGLKCATNPCKRVTRSQSASINASNKSTYSESVINEPLTDVGTWVDETSEMYEVESEQPLQDSAPSLVTSFTRSTADCSDLLEAETIPDESDATESVHQSRYSSDNAEYDVQIPVSNFSARDSVYNSKIKRLRRNQPSSSGSKNAENLGLVETSYEQQIDHNRKLQRYLNKKGKYKRQKENYFKCKECYHVTKTSQEMMQHDMDFHSMLPLFVCKVCKLRYTRKEYLEKHSIEHAIGPLYCYLCEEEATTHRELQLHLELHAIRSYKCPTCSRSFLKEDGLRVHIEKSRSAQKNKTDLEDGDDERNGYKSCGLRSNVAIKDRICYIAGEKTQSKRKPLKVSYTSKTMAQEAMVAMVKRNNYDRCNWKLGTVPLRDERTSDTEDFNGTPNKKQRLANTDGINFNIQDHPRREDLQSINYGNIIDDIDVVNCDHVHTVDSTNDGRDENIRFCRYEGIVWENDVNTGLDYDENSVHDSPQPNDIPNNGNLGDHVDNEEDLVEISRNYRRTESLLSCFPSSSQLVQFPPQIQSDNSTEDLTPKKQNADHIQQPSLSVNLEDFDMFSLQCLSPSSEKIIKKSNLKKTTKPPPPPPIIIESEQIMKPSFECQTITPEDQCDADEIVQDDTNYLTPPSSYDQSRSLAARVLSQSQNTRVC